MAGTRAEQAARKRARIVAAAERLFATRGYDGTSLQAVADAVGVGKANVYHYFRTKAELLDAALVASVGTVHDLLVQAARVPRGEERIRFLLDGYVELLVANRYRSSWGRAGPVPARERAARAFLEQLTGRAMRLVVDGPVTPTQELIVSQVLALQEAVPKLSALDDDELRELLLTTIDALLALDGPHHSQHPRSRS